MRPTLATHAGQMEVLVAALQRALADLADAARVDLLVEHARLDRRPLVRRHPLPGQRHDLEVVLGVALEGLLPVTAPDARSRRHEDAGPGTAHAGLPRAFAALHVAA